MPDATDLAPRVGSGYTYVSRIEKTRTDFGDDPSEAPTGRPAEALGADFDDPLLLAEEAPDRMRRRVQERPNPIARLAERTDPALDSIRAGIDRPRARGPAGRGVASRGTKQ